MVGGVLLLEFKEPTLENKDYSIGRVIWFQGLDAFGNGGLRCWAPCTKKESQQFKSKPYRD
jgi:hypothetical protein